MNDLANVDLDFEPQSRPRSCTWPTKRKNMENQDNVAENDVAMKLEPTIEEVGSREQLMMEPQISPNVTFPEMKQEAADSLLMSNAFPVSEFENSLVSSSSNFVTDYTNILTPTQQSPTVTTVDVNSNLSFTSLNPLPQPNNGSVSMCNFGANPLNGSPNAIDMKSNFADSMATSSPGHQQPNSITTSGDANVTNSVINNTSTTTTKPKTSSRKNAWGNMSYADLITQGIESSPDKRLTLAQIYDWMVKNVPYFKDKGDSNSSAGWKNSIRHNLSLHAKFKRIQNEGTGKSSWWVINHDAKPGKPNRRRTTSLDTSNPKFKQSRNKAISKKSELLKKQKSCSKRDSPPTWAKNCTGPDGSADYEHPVNKNLMTDYRPRASSNASSIGGRITPPRSFLTQDLEDDGPPPLSPLSSSSFVTPSGKIDLFGNDAFKFDDHLMGELDAMQTTGERLENINIDIASSPLTQCSTNDNTSIYLNSNPSTPHSSSRFAQQIEGVTRTAASKQQLSGDVTANSNNGILSSPSLATLLQSKNQHQKFQSMTKSRNQPANLLPNVDISSSMPRARANTMPKLQPQPKYNMCDTNLRRQQSGESLVQGNLYYAKSQQPQLPSSPESPYVQYQYGQNQPQPQQQAPQGFSSHVNQDKTIFQLLGQQQSTNVTSANQSRQLDQSRSNSLSVTDAQNRAGTMQQPNFTQNGELGSLNSDSKYPSDLNNINNQDMFDLGTFDLDDVLQDIKSPEIDGLGMEFNSYFPQGSFDGGEGDNSMETNSTDLNRGKMGSEATTSTYNYTSSQQMNTESPFMQPQQRYVQPMGLYDVNNGRTAQLLLGSNSSSNGPMLMSASGGSVGVGSGLSHFAHPHQVIRPQSSVGTISDYRM